MRACLILATAAALVGGGCKRAPPVNRYVLKEHSSWPHPIKNPFLWSASQIREAAPIGADGALCHATADINRDGVDELFVHADVPARVRLILVFEHCRDGYRYVGDFTACRSHVSNPEKGTLTVYEACGGKQGFIRTYVMRDSRLKLIRSSTRLSVGDGGRDADNSLLTRLGKDNILKWERVPNSSVQGGRGQRVGRRDDG
jgi:hypothetical protein